MSIRKSIILFILILLLAGGQVHALDKVGTTGFIFMQLPATARQFGVGEAYTALSPNNASAVFHNPAGIALNSGISISGTWGDWMKEMNYYTAVSET